jgi:hypothetical protein
MNRIFDELKESKVLLSMLSPLSISRPWINFEAGAAWMGKTKVIPVCFGGLSSGTLPKPYSSLQAVDIEIYEGQSYLVSSIAHYLELAQPDKPIFSDEPWHLECILRTAEVFAEHNAVVCWPLLGPVAPGLALPYLHCRAGPCTAALSPTRPCRSSWGAGSAGMSRLRIRPRSTSQPTFINLQFS